MLYMYINSFFLSLVRFAFTFVYVLLLQVHVIINKVEFVKPLSIFDFHKKKVCCFLIRIKLS